MFLFKTMTKTDFCHILKYYIKNNLRFIDFKLISYKNTKHREFNTSTYLLISICNTLFLTDLFLFLHLSCISIKTLRKQHNYLFLKHFVVL